MSCEYENFENYKNKTCSTPKKVSTLPIYLQTFYVVMEIIYVQTLQEAFRELACEFYNKDFLNNDQIISGKYQCFDLADDPASMKDSSESLVPPYCLQSENRKRKQGCDENSEKRIRSSSSILSNFSFSDQPVNLSRENISIHNTILEDETERTSLEFSGSFDTSHSKSEDYSRLFESQYTSKENSARISDCSFRSQPHQGFYENEYSSSAVETQVRII